MNSLLVFRGFANESQCVLAAVQRLALGLVELFLKASLSVRGSLQGFNRSLEVSGAAGAHGHGGNSSEPFHYAQIAFLHAN
jgi:hypothetical protein